MDYTFSLKPEFGKPKVTFSNSELVRSSDRKRKVRAGFPELVLCFIAFDLHIRGNVYILEDDGKDSDSKAFLPCFTLGKSLTCLISLSLLLLYLLYLGHLF